MTITTVRRAGWAASVEQFLETNRELWLDDLSSHHMSCMLMPPDASQMTAWRNEFRVLHDGLTSLVRRRPEARSWGVIFEYELLRERGRRPDVVVLTGREVLVLEFKDMDVAAQAHKDQAGAYARDLRHYHAASHDLSVIPFLVLTRSSGHRSKSNDVEIVPRDGLPSALDEAAVLSSMPVVDVAGWLAAEYAPLPSLVSAARTIFRHDPLPSIRRAHSAGIPEVVEELISISRHAHRDSELHLALVTGVPGAGKTLVGLQFVYANHIAQSDDSRDAVFLSGNGPLVKVLQHALKNKIFVQDVHGFLKEHGGEQPRLPTEHIFVYDEAQRAWDADRVRAKRGHAKSEPEDFLHIAERLGGWAMMVGLIGEGQEIHLGEEAGLGQWNDAIASMDHPWIVHCSPHISHVFGAASTVHETNSLNLTTSLRTHLAEDVQSWIRLTLEGDLHAASEFAGRMRRQGFDLYLTRDLDVAKSYVRQRYEGELDKRYGLLASSKANNLAPHGIRNDWAFTKNFREGPWYNDEPSSTNSSCQLREVATEFSCQGLELDFPIVCWGNDLRWDESRHQWVSRPQPRSSARDPHQLRVNSYRVLLSRGRDGLISFVPSDVEMASTAHAIELAGAEPLDR